MNLNSFKFYASNHTLFKTNILIQLIFYTFPPVSFPFFNFSLCSKNKLFSSLLLLPPPHEKKMPPHQHKQIKLSLISNIKKKNKAIPTRQKYFIYQIKRIDHNVFIHHKTSQKRQSNPNVLIHHKRNLRLQQTIHF